MAILPTTLFAFEVPIRPQYTAAVTDHGKLISLVAGKRWSLLMAEDDDKLFMTRSQSVARLAVESNY